MARTGKDWKGLGERAGDGSLRARVSDIESRQRLPASVATVASPYLRHSRSHRYPYRSEPYPKQADGCAVYIRAGVKILAKACILKCPFARVNSCVVFHFLCIAFD